MITRMENTSKEIPHIVRIFAQSLCANSQVSLFFMERMVRYPYIELIFFGGCLFHSSSIRNMVIGMSEVKKTIIKVIVIPYQNQYSRKRISLVGNKNLWKIKNLRQERLDEIRQNEYDKRRRLLNCDPSIKVRCPL